MPILNWHALPTNGCYPEEASVLSSVVQNTLLVCTPEYPVLLQARLGEVGEVGFKAAMRLKWLRLNKSGPEP